jgi:hypothetical protein
VKLSQKDIINLNVPKSVLLLRIGYRPKVSFWDKKKITQ